MSKKLFAGFDVGGTKALGVVVADDYEVIATARDTSAGDGDALTQTLAGLCEELTAAASKTLASQTSDSQANPSPVRFESVGLAVAGLADRSGVVRYSPNLPDILEYPLVNSLTAELTSRLGYQPAISLDNDATAGTWAEAHLGAGRDCAEFIFITLGTGIGTGYVANGRLVLGVNGFAGEAGHMVVDANGPSHITNVKGPWEYFASGEALGRMARQAATEGRFDVGLELANNAAAITSHNVHTAVAAGDAQALELLREYCVQVALGTANLVMIFDPQRIIIGGGVADIGEPLRELIQSELAKAMLGISFRPVPEVVLAELGVEASAIGAALMANDRL